MAVFELGFDLYFREPIFVTVEWRARGGMETGRAIAVVR